jgi:sulfate adenylyltransferase large subunit
MAGTLRVATAGSVDDGKSTLIGRLLVDAKQVLEDQLEALERANGADGLNLAHLTDGLKAERERGITIDVAYRYFATPRRRFILADTPGHEEFTRNTVTGASTADAFIVLVDARRGLVTQSRRHTAIGALLEVPHLVLAVNKMDLVDFDAGVFHAIADEWRRLAARLHAHDVHAVPISALEGDNVVEPSARTPWYEGPALLELLETLPRAEASGGGLRLPVQRVLDGRLYAGQVERGSVRPGDRVVVAPGGAEARVQCVELLGRRLDEAGAPRSVAVALENGARAARGDVIAAADDPPAVARRLDATLCWLQDAALAPGSPLLMKLGTRTIGATVTDVRARIDVATLERESAAGTLGLNDLGDVGINLEAPVAVDRYGDSRYTGSFILIDPATHATLAGGMVTAAG